MSSLRTKPLSFLLSASAVVVALAGSGTPVAAAQDFDAEQLKTGVVRVDTTRDPRVPPEHKFDEWLVSENGTGFVIAQGKGYADILTARHVIAENQSVTVHFYSDPMTAYTAQVLPDTSSPELDFAILRVTFPSGANPLQGLQPLRFAPPSSLRQGVTIFTMNSAYDLVPNNVVNLKMPHEPGRFKTTVGSTGPGFSGGPVFDAQGHLVGMHTSSTAEDGKYAVSDRIAAVLEMIGTTPYPIEAMNDLLPATAEASRPTGQPSPPTEDHNTTKPATSAASVPSPNRKNKARASDSAASTQQLTPSTTQAQPQIPLTSSALPPSASKGELMTAVLVRLWNRGIGGNDRGIAWNPAGTQLAVVDVIGQDIPILDSKETVINRYFVGTGDPSARLEWRDAGLFFGAPDTHYSVQHAVRELSFFPSMSTPFAGSTMKLKPVDGWSTDKSGKRFAFRIASLSGADGNSSITIRDAFSDEQGCTLADNTFTMALSPDGQRLATGLFNLKFWDVSKCSKVLDASATVPIKHIMDQMEWSSDGRYLATHTEDEKFLRIWDAQTGSLLSTTPAHGKAVTSMSWSPDSRRIATSGDDSKAIVSSVITGRELMTIRPGGQQSDFSKMAVAWNPKDNTLALSTLERTELYDVGEY